MLLYNLNNSSCRKAATQQIPSHVHQYVTGVSEESQRTCNLKYDGYIYFSTFLSRINHFDKQNLSARLHKLLSMLSKSKQLVIRGD